MENLISLYFNIWATRSICYLLL